MYRVRPAASRPLKELSPAAGRYRGRTVHDYFCQYSGAS
jgi:hypothetical protein